jgi:hypothetical protein
VLARAWPELEATWVGTGARRSQEKLQRGRAAVVEVKATGRKTKGIGVNLAPGRPIYRGSTESARCGSFCRTTCVNGSIPRSSRKDQGGYFANTLQLRLKL